ncbi:MAG: SDR family NAD(P)-dependent oxidoreductase [Pseudomonadota bacterium]
MKVVITGAAHGLGRALTEAVIARGDDVIAVDHDDQALGQINGAISLALDLTGAHSADAIAAHGPIDLIIHCAGISGTGPFEQIPTDRHRAIIALNFEAPVQITCALLAQGALSATSTHAFVGSLSTYTGYPGAVSYAASKDGLASFARSLNAALPKGQRAACIFPGPMATDHAARYAPENSAKTVAARQSPADAATLILAALDAGKTTIVPGAKARALALAGRLAPTLMARALKKGIYDKLSDPKL